MKVKDRVLDVTTNIEGKKFGMTIHKDAMRHIMTVLTDLYSNPRLAIIREYATNAFDAHVEAGLINGKSVPIEVFLPSALSPFFKVRDFGDGLNADDIDEIYSQYGASTKRSSNDVVGMLGLGCKSALTYTDQFTVTGHKNGITTVVSVSRDADGAGSMTVLDEYESEEPSGVEIIVPTKRNDNDQFAQDANNFFRFWNEGTVLVNGKPPKRIDGIWVTDDLLLTSEADRHYVVMGNVAYPFLDEFQDNDYYNRNNAKTVAFIDIGDVEFVPSREALQTTASVKKALTEIKQRMKKERDKAFRKELAGSKTMQEALTKYLELQTVGFEDKAPTWNGKAIPLRWEARDFLAGVAGERPAWKTAAVQRYRGMRASDNAMSISNTKLNDYVWVKNFDGMELTSYKREKMNQYVERTNHSFNGATTFLLVDDVPAEILPWVSSSNILDWAVVGQEKIVRDKVKTLNGRPTGSYKGYVNGKYTDVIKAAEIDTTKPVFYSRGNVDRWGYTGQQRNYDALHSAVGDCTCVVLGQNRIAKFKRDFPQVKELNEYMKGEAKTWQESITPDDKLYLYLSDDSDVKSRLTALHPLVEGIVDPNLVAAINLAKAKIPSDLLTKWNRWRQWGATYEYKFDNPLNQYPLLTSYYNYGTLSSTVKEHMTIYINAVYAAGKGA